MNIKAKTASVQMMIILNAKLHLAHTIITDFALCNASITVASLSGEIMTNAVGGDETGV
jgi:hypothetical protein